MDCWKVLIHCELAEMVRYTCGEKWDTNPCESAFWGILFAGNLSQVNRVDCWNVLVQCELSKMARFTCGVVLYKFYVFVMCFT